jgi:hypothetical protein
MDTRPIGGGMIDSRDGDGITVGYAASGIDGRPIGGGMINWQSGSGGGVPVGITAFASTGRRDGPDPGRSTGTQS